MAPNNDSDPSPWSLLKTETVFRNRWLRLDIDTVRLPDGRSYEYTVLREKRDGVAVIALNEENQVLLQREYRHPVAQVIWQMPGGLVDEGESPLAAAQRELYEETGHRAANWHYLGAFWDNPALEDMEIHLFVATRINETQERHLDEAEWVRWQWQSWRWLKKAVSTGEIKERVILAALGMLWAEDALPKVG